MKFYSSHMAVLSATLLFPAVTMYAADIAAPQTQTITAESPEGKTLDQSWRVDGDVTVDISNVRGNVVVTGWDQAQAKLGGSLGAGSKLEISGDARHLSLHVQGAASSHWFGGDRVTHDSDLVLSLPHAANLKLNVVSADASVNGVSGKSLEVDGVSGQLTVGSDAPDVKVNDVSGNIVFAATQPNAATRAHLQTVSGDIDAKKLGGSIKLETVSGDITLDAGVVQELETGTVSGEARIHVTPAAHARMELESMSGTISLYVPVALSAHIDAQTFSGRIRTDYGKVQNKEHGSGSSLDALVGDGDAKINAQTFSGNIEFHKNQE